LRVSLMSPLGKKSRPYIGTTRKVMIPLQKIEEPAGMKRIVPALLLATALSASAQTVAGNPRAFSHADTLRGSNGPARAWWDVEFYDLHVTVSPNDSTIRGWNGIAYKALRAGSELQVDLQVPMQLDSITQNGKAL